MTNVNQMSNLNFGKISNYQLIMGQTPQVSPTTLSVANLLDSNGVIQYRTGAMIATLAASPLTTTPFLYDSTKDIKLYPSTGTQLLIGIIYQDGVFPLQGNVTTVSTTGTLVTANTGVWGGGVYTAGNIPQNNGFDPVQASAVISNVATLDNLQIGMSISGTGIPSGSVIIAMAVDTNNVNYLLISGNVTSAGVSVNLTITNITPRDLLFPVAKYAPQTWWRTGTTDNNNYIFGVNGANDGIALEAMANSGNIEVGNRDGSTVIRFNGLISAY